MTLTVKHAGMSDRGRVREKNEDNWTADPKQGLYIVSDGLGGQFAGALASKIVVEVLPRLIQERLDDADDLAEPDVAEQVRGILYDLSQQVYEQTHGEPGLEGMGATVVLALLRDGEALIAHMGDSRAYRLRSGQLEQLTKDHSLVQLLIDSGDISPKEAATHPARGQVTRSVGMEGEPLPEVQATDIIEGDRLLLCTDGLTGMLPESEVAGILMQRKGARATCRTLVQAALDAGGKDNVTVVLVDAVAAGL